MGTSRSNNAPKTDVTQKGRSGEKEREGGDETICKKEAVMVRQLRGDYLITGVLGWGVRRKRNPENIYQVSINNDHEDMQKRRGGVVGFRGD